MRSHKALVTGASGFLAPFVIDALAQAGWSSRRVSRVAGPSQDSRDTIVVRSITDDVDWGRALEGVDAVIHLAAVTGRNDPLNYAERREVFQTNCEATQSLADAALRSGVTHFVFMSSIGVHGANTEGRTPIRESDPLVPESTYSESKAAAEKVLNKRSASGDMAVSIIRAPMVYGRGGRGSFARLTRAVRAGVPLPFGLVKNRRAFVAAENLANFVAFRLSSTPKSGTFIVADREQVSTAEFVERIGKAAGRRAVLVPIPPALLRAVLRASGNRLLAQSTTDSLEVDTSRARDTGWAPPLTMDEGLSRALSAIAQRV